MERGEELTITRRGVPVARMVPVRAVEAPAIALSERLRASRLKLREEGFKPLTIEEILEFRDAGRK